MGYKSREKIPSVLMKSHLFPSFRENLFVSSFSSSLTMSTPMERRTCMGVFISGTDSIMAAILPISESAPVATTMPRPRP